MPPFDRETPIGFIGLGVMGAGMAMRLIGAGYRVTVHNRSAAREAPFVAAGAASARSPRETAERSRLLFLSLPATADVEQVLFGADGAAAALAPGSCVVDTSSISAQATRAFAARLAEAGVAMLDAPVSGGKAGAEQGTLTCIVGGPEDAFEACREPCSAIAARYLRIGDHGAGQIAKSCNQIAVVGALVGVAEALVLARKNGVDPVTVREALLGGAAKSFSLEKHGQRIIDHDFGTGFAARLMLKDLDIATRAGRDSGTFLPSTHLAMQLLETLVAQGGGDGDWSALGGLYERLSGLGLPSQAQEDL